MKKPELNVDWLSGEEWCDIEGYEGRYAVSTHGRVYSYKAKRLLKPTVSFQGYFYVSLPSHKMVKTYVHRLVATTFIPNPQRLPMVNHIDADKLNNMVTNLEWTDSGGNRAHAKANGLYPCGERHPLAKLTANDVIDARARFASGESIKQIADELNRPYATVYSAIMGRNWLSPRALKGEA